MTFARDLASLGDNTSKLEQQGLVQVIASSVTKGASGSASVDSKGNVTFSGTESIALNSVFSATYDFYRIVMQIKPTTGNNITFRFRASGVDNSGATSYRSQQGVFGGGSASAKRNDTSAFNLNYDNNTPEWKNLAYDIIRPLSTDVDKFIFGFGYGENGIIFSGGQLTSSTQFDGFNVITNTSNISGTIRVYGYNQ
jgi:hypothetical protein